MISLQGVGVFCHWPHVLVLKLSKHCRVGHPSHSSLGPFSVLPLSFCTWEKESTQPSKEVPPGSRWKVHSPSQSERVSLPTGQEIYGAS